MNTWMHLKWKTDALLNLTAFLIQIEVASLASGVDLHKLDSIRKVYIFCCSVQKICQFFLHLNKTKHLKI